MSCEFTRKAVKNFYQLSFPEFTMAQEGESPVLVFNSPVMVLYNLVLVFTQSSFNFYRAQF